MNINEMQTALVDLGQRVTKIETSDGDKPKHNGYKKRYCLQYSADQRIVLKSAFDALDFTPPPSVIHFWEAAKRIDTELHGKGKEILGVSANYPRLKNLLLEFYGWGVTWRSEK